MKVVARMAIFILMTISMLSCGSNNESKAPNFILKTLEGENLNSQKFKGKVVVVDFWATWCQPCIREIPSYNALFNKFKDENFVFLGVTMDSGPAEKVKPFVDEYGIEYPIYLGDENLKEAFGGIWGYPTTYVIDQNWNVQKKYVGGGPQKVEEISEIVKRLLSKG